MVKNYLKTALRNLVKNKVHAFINIGGLAIGLGAFMLIYQFISFEKSFDDFHAHGDRIYRIQYEKVFADSHDKSAGVAAGGGAALTEEYPEVEAFTKLWSPGFMTNLFTVNGEGFVERDIFYADDQYFEFFDFPFVHGAADKALEEVNTVVLTESTAQRFFGRTDVVGELIQFSNGWGTPTLKVSAVMVDLPDNTHFKFEALISMATLVAQSDGSAATTFGWNAFPTYIRLVEGTSPVELIEKFPAFYDKYYADVRANGAEPSYKLRPLKDIYLHSNVSFEVGPTGSHRVVNILMGVALFILILAYFNYINLSTSHAFERAKEVGVRKVNGANMSQLFAQFMTEAFLFNLISVALGFTLMQVSKPLFEQMLGRGLGNEVIPPTTTWFIAIGLLFIGTLVSGIYPALILSRLRTLGVLKGRPGFGGAGVIRKGLVVMQFAILCFMLVGSLAVRSQIKYMLNADWGFDSERMLIVNGPASGANNEQKLTRFKQALAATPGVLGVSNSTTIPGREISWINNNVKLEGMADNEFISTPLIGASDGFLKNMNLQLVAGRDFDASRAEEGSKVMISTTAMNQLGQQDPEAVLGKTLFDSGTPYQIIGVVDDFMQDSFKKAHEPIVYRYIPFANNFFNIKINGEMPLELVAEIESAYQEQFPGNPYHYVFLDEFYQRQFEEDLTFGRIFNLFTMLGIWISCLGLIGLTSYTVAQRTKEIGIRKVLGASMQSIILLISSRFFQLVALAVLIAVPISYWAVSEWLSSYSFATAIQPIIFIIPVVAIATITLLTTGLLSLRTGLKNPVDALRYE